MMRTGIASPCRAMTGIPASGTWRRRRSTTSSTDIVDSEHTKKAAFTGGFSMGQRGAAIRLAWGRGGHRPRLCTNARELAAVGDRDAADLVGLELAFIAAQD